MNAILIALTALGLVNDRWDDAYTTNLETQLEYLKAQTYDVKYPALKARQFIPVSNEASNADETVSYEQWDEFGMAQILANGADDLPLIDALAKKFSAPIKSLGAKYSYSMQDVRRSAENNRRLVPKKANAARRAIETLIDDIGVSGDDRTGLKGIANNANVTLVTPDTGTWATATGLEMYDDVCKLLNSIVTASQDVFEATQVVLPTAQYQLIAKKLMTTTGDGPRTVLEALQAAFPEVTFSRWNKLKDKDAGGTGPRIIAYPLDAEVLQMEIPQEFEQFPPQAKNLNMEVPCHARTGGVNVYYPVAMAYMDGC